MPHKSAITASMRYNYSSCPHRYYLDLSEGKDPAVRQRILDYNEDNVRATRVLLDGIKKLNLL